MPPHDDVRTRRPVMLRYCFGDDRPARRIRRVRPPTLRPSGCEGGGQPLRETASERMGEATAPAIASERATAFLALVLMPRIISKIFRAVLWVPVAALHHTSNDHLRTHETSPRESPLNGERPFPTSCYIFASMSGIFDLSRDENAKHFLPRWLSDAPT